jgi:hypothetical protein
VNRHKSNGSDVTPVSASPAAEGERQIGRNTLLRMGGVAAAAGIGTVLLRPTPAGATTGGMQFGQQNDAGTDPTLLTSASNTGTLQLSNDSGAPALDARSGGAAVVGAGTTGGGVVGVTRGSGPGLLGHDDAAASAATGPAVKGELDNPVATAATIEAAQNGAGPGVFSHIDNPTNANRAAHALTSGVGIAVFGQIANAKSVSAAVRGQTTGSGAGLDGVSALGAGGRFVGKTAQIQLVPSTASSHPVSGIAGQLFVDRSNRLWFCKGGTNWRQLA